MLKYGFVVFLFIIIKDIFIKIYCIIYANKDKKHAENGRKEKEEEIKVGIIRRIIRFLFFVYLYSFVRYNIILVGKIPSYYLRYLKYKYVYGANISRKARIAAGCEIRSPWNLNIGKAVIMNSCILDARSGICIGDNVVLGCGVHIWTQEHDVNSSDFRVSGIGKEGCVSIGNRAWICSDSTILPGIVVGEGAVLASRGCATRDLAPYCIYMGVPAKNNGRRNENLTYEIDSNKGWYFV